MPPDSAPKPISTGRAEHAVGRFAEDLAPPDLHAVRHGRADCRERHEVADLHVERAAPHLERLAVARVDVDALHVVRLGMGSQREHLRHDHAVDRLADAIDVVDRKAEVVHQLGERVGIVADGRELMQPRQHDLHQNCSGTGCRW